jgi:hypothetical protein
MKFGAIMSVGWRFEVRILTRWLEDMKLMVGDWRNMGKEEEGKSRQICHK